MERTSGNLLFDDPLGSVCFVANIDRGGRARKACHELALGLRVLP